MYTEIDITPVNVADFKKEPEDSVVVPGIAIAVGTCCAEWVD